jgi:hypothetical protein
MSDMTYNRKDSNFASEATFLQPVFQGEKNEYDEDEKDEKDEKEEIEEEIEEKQGKSKSIFNYFRTKKQIKKNEEKKRINNENIQKAKEYDKITKLTELEEKEKKRIRLKKERQEEIHQNRRGFWENAKNNLLAKFIQENCSEKPFVIGLQEMNLTSEGDTGSNAITRMLNQIVGENKFHHICREINTIEKGKPALSIIYDDKTFGKPLANRIIDNWTTGQEGRPLLMVITVKRYVFVNIHGGQEPTKGNPYEKGNRENFNESIVKLNKEFLEKSVETFCRFTFFDEINNNKLDVKSLPIFIMGDLNDRYDAIKEFTIFGKPLKYNGESPKSCCHNWDSACSDTYYKTTNEFTEVKGDFYPEDKEKPITYMGMGITGGSGNYCQVPKIVKDPDGIKIQDKYDNYDDENLKMSMPVFESKIRNYRFKGDKVFGKVYVEQQNEKELQNYQNYQKEIQNYQEELQNYQEELQKYENSEIKEPNKELEKQKTELKEQEKILETQNVPLPIGVIEMFDKINRYNNRSTESDHELVFATFPLPPPPTFPPPTTSGGKRRSKTRKHHSKKSKNNRRTR